MGFIYCTIPAVQLLGAGCEIKVAGGKVINDHGNHVHVFGITAEKGAEVLKGVVKNLNK